MTEAATEKASKDRTAKLNRAYAEASKRLREVHRTEFLGYQTEEAAKLGIDFTPKPTKAEKAEADLAALLEANPDLEQRIVANIEKKIHASMETATPGYETAPAVGQPA